MTGTSKIQEVFGSFITKLGKDEPSIFATLALAEAALAEYENGAEQRTLAANYCTYIGIKDKNAKGKTNIITGFLSWVDAGMPAPEAKEENSSDVPETTADDKAAATTEEKEVEF